MIRATFASICLRTRLDLDIPQADLARRAGISRGYLARIERGRANPSLALVETIAEALGLELQLSARPPIVLSERGVHDIVHARCSAYVDRRLTRLGLLTAREVEVADRRLRGWIDLLAFDPRSATLFVIEVKTRFDDLGQIERQLGVYERVAWSVARSIGWRAARLDTWLLALASDEVERVIQSNRSYFAQVFPRRAPSMSGLLDGSAIVDQGGVRPRGLALIDPSYRGRDWLIRTVVDGRRSVARYRDYADAARRAG
jgi:transcriptional regulator with XRE-family HTH domain